jgi:hypothetical protein
MAPISPGSSGGPVLSENGKTAGIATFQFEKVQNLNFAVDAEHIHPLIDQHFGGSGNFHVSRGLTLATRHAGIVSAALYWERRPNSLRRKPLSSKPAHNLRDALAALAIPQRRN